MNNFVVVVFPDEARAEQGVRSLDDLHREGRITVYATAGLRRAPNGDVSIERHSHRDLLGLGSRRSRAGWRRCWAVRPPASPLAAWLAARGAWRIWRSRTS